MKEARTMHFLYYKFCKELEEGREEESEEQCQNCKWGKKTMVQKYVAMLFFWIKI